MIGGLDIDESLDVGRAKLYGTHILLISFPLYLFNISVNQ